MVVPVVLESLSRRVLLGHHRHHHGPGSKRPACAGLLPGASWWPGVRPRTGPSSSSARWPRPREWLLVIIHSRFGRFFAHPIVAAINFAGSLVVFYYTPAFEYALSTHIGHILMTVHFTLA